MSLCQKQNRTVYDMEKQKNCLSYALCMLCMFVNKERCKNLPVKFECVTHMRADTVLQASPSSKLNMRLTPIICVLCFLLLAVAGNSYSPLSSLHLQFSRFSRESQERPDLRC